MRIAVDVMGTDLGPVPMLQGTLDAVARDDDLTCVIFATEEVLEAHMQDDLGGRMERRAVLDVVGMSDEPARAVRSKRDSSLLRALTALRDGEVDSVVTASNTGAVVLAASAILRRLPGVLHPTLGTILSYGGGRPTVLVDCGATLQREAAWIVQYAHLGAALVEAALEEPASIGLLANGVEVTKGDDTIREAHERLAACGIAYKGLVEPAAIFADEPNVVVTDGLVGNVVLKTIEATWRSVLGPIVDDLLRTDMALALSGRLVNSVGERLGQGALLLGVNGIVVKAHGLGTSKGASSGIRFASALAQCRVLDFVRSSVSSMAP